MFQIVWGGLLILFGIGMFFAIPGKMAQIQKEYESLASGFGSLFAHFSLYLIGILLIGGGSKKIYENVRGSENTADASDPE